MSNFYHFQLSQGKLFILTEYIYMYLDTRTSPGGPNLENLTWERLGCVGFKYFCKETTLLNIFKYF